MKKIIVLFFVLNISLCLGQNNDYNQAMAQLKDAINNINGSQILAEKVISNEEVALKYAELILFDIYGKDNIIEQRPYEINLTNEYWIIQGRLKEDIKGGTFLIIFNSKNGKIIKLTHGK